MLQCFSWEDHQHATQNPPPDRRELQIDETLKKTDRYRAAAITTPPGKNEETDPSRIIVECSPEDFEYKKPEKYTDGLEELFGDNEDDEPTLSPPTEIIPEASKKVEAVENSKSDVLKDAEDDYDDVVRAEVKRFLDDDAPP